MLGLLSEIATVDKLYIQLLFDCNFRCRHCFQGKNLERPDRIRRDSAEALLVFFRERYESSAVCFLGGEPLRYGDLLGILRFAKSMGYQTEICSNGWELDKLKVCQPSLDYLRISVDGTEEVHDSMRRQGSFGAALRTLDWARGRLRTGVTCTVTSENADTVPQLRVRLRELEVSEMVLHNLRTLGNAARFGLKPLSRSEAAELVASLSTEQHLPPVVRLDSDFLEKAGCEVPEQRDEKGRLDRIEISPDGKLYVSCKAVGSDSNAYRYDFHSNSLVYEPSARDEISQKIPQVRYV